MNEIKQIRMALGISQREMARRLGMGEVGRRNVRRWEKGEVTPYPETMEQIRNLTGDAHLTKGESKCDTSS